MKWLNRNNMIILNIFMLVLILIFSYQTFAMKDSIKSTHKLQIFSQTNQKLSIDFNIQNEVLKNEIKRIEDINDKRFELLAWFLAILFSIVTVFLTFQFINSKTTVRDIAYDELNKIIPDINKLIEERTEFIKSELKKMKDDEIQ